MISLLIYIHPKSLKPEWGQCPFDSFDSFEYLAGSWFQKKRPPGDRPVHLLNLLNGGGHSKDPAGRPAHLLILLKGGGIQKATGPVSFEWGRRLLNGPDHSKDGRPPAF